MRALLRELVRLMRCYQHRVHQLPCHTCPNYPCDYEWRDDLD